MAVALNDYEELLGPGKGAQTARGHRRRDQILKVAAELFAQHGYDSVSINDIGHACGVTGPAIYRYFPSKELLLSSIYQHLYERYTDGLKALTSSDLSPLDMLGGLIDLQVQLATEEPEKIRIADREERHLPEDTAAAFRRERQQMLKTWSTILRQVRPELATDEADVTTHGILAMVNAMSLRRSSDRGSERLCEHLRQIAMSAALGSAS